MERNIVIRHNGEELTASIHYPNKEKGTSSRCKDRLPLAVICHGFVGNRIGVDRIFVKAAVSWHKRDIWLFVLIMWAAARAKELWRRRYGIDDRSD